MTDIEFKTADNIYPRLKQGDYVYMPVGWHRSSPCVIGVVKTARFGKKYNLTLARLYKEDPEFVILKDVITELKLALPDIRGGGDNDDFNLFGRWREEVGCDYTTTPMKLLMTHDDMITAFKNMKLTDDKALAFSIIFNVKIGVADNRTQWARQLNTDPRDTWRERSHLEKVSEIATIFDKHAGIDR